MFFLFFLNAIIDALFAFLIDKYSWIFIGPLNVVIDLIY